MSKFTGKCDLYDHIYMIGSKGTDDSMTDLERFEVFKQRTGGKIYQTIPVELTKFNIEYFLANDEQLVKTSDGYQYWGKTFKTLKQLNKHGYWTKRTIEFETMLDILPYVGNIISLLLSNEGHETVFISRKSYPEMRYDESLEYGHPRDCSLEFRRSLQAEFRKIAAETEQVVETSR